MADDEQSCPACGARVPAGADQCDLCGTPVDTAGEAPAPEATPEDETDAVPDGTSTDPPSDPDPESSPPQAVYCTQCGHENPTSANFCSRCGTALEDLSAAAAPDGTRAVTADLPDGTASSSPEASSAEAAEEEAAEEAAAQDDREDDPAPTQLLWMVGIGVAVVLAFFGLTQWSQQYDWGEDEAGEASSTPSASAPAQDERPAADPASGGSPRPQDGGTPEDLQALVTELSDSVSGSVAGTIDSLRALEANATGSELRDLRTRLIQLYIGAGTPGRAALLQRTLADATGDVEDRRRAADLLYRWMRKVEQESGRARVADVAQHVAKAYSDVVEQRPQDLDARTRMGEAYLLTNNPMKGIQAINNVLKDDSTFVPARFQKGLALLQINRLDQAVQQFERVKAHAKPENPFYQQATRAIEVIREQSSPQDDNPGQGGGTGS